jgi:hypothetical protein
MREQGPDGFPADKNLTEIAMHLDRGNYKWCFIPTHIDRNHWILFEADMEQGTISWGESLRAN